MVLQCAMVSGLHLSGLICLCSLHGCLVKRHTSVLRQSLTSLCYVTLLQGESAQVPLLQHFSVTLSAVDSFSH